MTPFLILQIALVCILLATSVYGIKHTESKYRRRNDFSRRDKQIIRREIQNGKCPLCRKKLYGRIEYHHKDGNRTNNRLSNGLAMHRHCHMLITGKNQKHYRNQTNWSSLKLTIVSTFMLLIVLVVSKKCFNSVLYTAIPLDRRVRVNINLERIFQMSLA